jgi:hypothetical protein
MTDDEPGPRSDDELRAVRLGPVTPHNAPITLVEYDEGWPALSARGG